MFFCMNNQQSARKYKKVTASFLLVSDEIYLKYKI